MENLSLNDKERMIAIIYHYPCYDGSYAAVNAYCYYAYFCIHKNNNVKFFPSNSQNRINEVELKKFEKVYILDKGLNDIDLEYIYETAIKHKQIKFIIIDHHISSIDYFDDNYKEKFAPLKNVKIIFDKTETRSACGITFEYFKKKSEKYTNESNSYIYGEAYKKVTLLLI
jgi:hypothetical protein